MARQLASGKVVGMIHQSLRRACALFARATFTSLLSLPLLGAEPEKPADTTNSDPSEVGLTWQREYGATHEQRMQWWREARFGMFIHWGVYSVPAGVWQGTNVTRSGAEWIM